MIKAHHLTLDYLNNPTGIDNTSQFGWKISSDKNNVLQTAYHLQIALDEKFTKVIWDTGKIISEESAHVTLKGLSLKSITIYFWRIRLWDNQGEESDWSQVNSFISAYISNDEWKSNFISAESETEASVSKGTYVRTAFSVGKKVESAIATVTALGLYKFYVNGKKVGNDELTPGWTSYHKHLLYQTYDISECLQAGENAIGAMLGPGWYKGTMGFLLKRNHYGTRTAFLCQIRIKYTDGTGDTVISDNTWKSYDAPVLFSEIYDGEAYDARLEINGWNQAGFDDGNWRQPEIVPYDKNVLKPQKGCAVKELDRIQAKELIITPEGHKVLNFAQNLSGWVHFKVKGKAGDRVVLKHFEILDAKGNVYLDNLRKAKQTVTYILKGNGEEEFHPNFTFQGFQYVKIEEYPGDINIEDFTAVAVHSDMENTGTFQCSNPSLNQLQHNILWGLKGNFIDIPTDCPQRDERLGWTGDAQIFCRTASYLMNTYNFYRKWLLDVAADQTLEGGVPHVIPDILTGKSEEDWLLSEGTHSAAAWADAAVIIPWTMYLAYGDSRILEDQYTSMKAWIEFMRRHSEGGTWSYKLQYGDWVALDAEEGSYFGATPNDLTCAAYYAYSTNLFAKTAKILGMDNDYRIYSELHQELKKWFQKTFFNDDGTITVRTQTSHILALCFDLTPEEYRQTTINTLLDLLAEKNGHLVTGFVGTPYICHALSQNGHTAEAYELLLKDDFPSWLYQVKMGATTIWEHWDGMKPDGTMWSPDMNSFNHYAYGAIGEWLYRRVAGIDIDEERAGYKHIIIHPHIGGGLDYVTAAYESVYGKINVHWENVNNEITLTVSIPHNTTAKVILENAIRIKAEPGVNLEAFSGGSQSEIGSGEYRFIYELAQ